jgi:hypothetical protein
MQDDVYVGRVRRDISRSDDRGLDLFVCGDQIKKGELSCCCRLEYAAILMKPEEQHTNCAVPQVQR